MTTGFGQPASHGRVLSLTRDTKGVGLFTPKKNPKEKGPERQHE